MYSCDNGTRRSGFCSHGRIHTTDVLGASDYDLQTVVEQVTNCLMNVTDC